MNIKSPVSIMGKAEFVKERQGDIMATDAHAFEGWVLQIILT
jgi:hypothetical protein